MIPSRSLQRRLARASICVMLSFGTAGCGGDDVAVAPATAVAPASSAEVSTTTVPPPDSTSADQGSESTGQASTGSTSVSAPTTLPSASSTAPKPGATTVPAAAGSTTTVKSVSTSTTVRVTPTTVKPPTTTVPAPPTTKPAANPGTFTATVANKSHRTLNIPYNATVVLTVTSATDEEFHVHGYDITKGGTNVTFVFAADMKGTYIVESHDTGWVVCTLVVA